METTWPEGVAAITATLMHEHDGKGMHAMYAADFPAEVLAPMFAKVDAAAVDNELVRSAHLDSMTNLERVAYIATAKFLVLAGRQASRQSGSMVQFMPGGDPVWDGARFTAPVSVWVVEGSTFVESDPAVVVLNMVTTAEAAVPDDISSIDGGL